ncbi:MAG: MerR family transcriptional regulator [Chloroflexota bacterium]
MKYTVKQLAQLAGVSARTLRYYDSIGLLKPNHYGENGYRYYDDEALLRLQQIRFYRALDFSLEVIGAILNAPDFDLLTALQTHRQALAGRVERFTQLIQTVDNTILHLKGVLPMKDKKPLFAGFDEEQQKEYEREAEQRWGSTSTWTESQHRWKSYTDEQKEQIFARASQIHHTILDNMDKGYDSPEVQQAVAAWYQHLGSFYEPNLEILRGLGQAYAEDPRFRASYEAMHPDMPDFMRQAIEFYCDRQQA